MGQELKLDLSKAKPYLEEREISMLAGQVKLAHEQLHQKTGAGNDFLGWVELPKKYNREEFQQVVEVAARIKDQAEVLVVIGIGGSYLGARAAIELLNNSFYSQLDAKQRQTPLILYAGQNISATYMAELLDLLAEKDFAVNVISKSGTTTEPAVAFRLLKELLVKKYGVDGAKKRIYATTDGARGALKKMADTEGYVQFVIPDDVGGRYSVLTPVGLLPIAVSGVNIQEIMDGALAGYQEYQHPDLETNPANRYAAARLALYRKGKLIEMLVNYEPGLHYFAEWWKQLYGESDGKDQKGIFPAACDFSTDLHSMGQYIQDGRRELFETVLWVEKPRRSLAIPRDPQDNDGLNFLASQTMEHINQKAFEGTLLAHNDGQVPNLVLKVPEITPYYFGKLVYFFEKACGISGYLNGVNPFDQPGVEAYKKNMFALLNKPGYEAEKAKLEARL